MASRAIVLATYNEAQNLPSLVERLERLVGDLHIYVVDDNSPDGTSALAQQLARRYGNISVITRPAKGGLGSALRTGLRAALEGGCDCLVTMDADLSHQPEEALGLLEVVESGRADMAQGSRYVRGGSTPGYSWRRRLLSRAANALYHRLLGTPAEVTSNFRAYSRRSAGVVSARCRCDGFTFQPEATLMLLNHGLRVREVPITFAHRASGESKLGSLQTLRGPLFFALALVTFRLKVGRFSRRGAGGGARAP